MYKRLIHNWINLSIESVNLKSQVQIKIFLGITQVFTQAMALDFVPDFLTDFGWNDEVSFRIDPAVSTIVHLVCLLTKVFGV